MPDELDVLSDDLDQIDYDLEPVPIEDPGRVNGLLRALGREQRRLERFDGIAKQDLAETEDRITRQRGSLAARVEWLTSTLELTHAGWLAAGRESGSVRLPAGDLRTTDGGVAWVWPDRGSEAETALLAWLDENQPEAVNRPPAPAPTIDKATAKKALADRAVTGSPQKPVHDDGRIIDASGEAVPGVTVAKKARTFKAEPYAHEIGGGS